MLKYLLVSAAALSLAGCAGLAGDNPFFAGDAGSASEAREGSLTDPMNVPDDHPDKNIGRAWEDSVENYETETPDEEEEPASGDQSQPSGDQSRSSGAPSSGVSTNPI